MSGKNTRPIDANALKETINAHDYVLKDCTNSTDKGMFTVGIMQAIDEQPTIDAEPQWIPCSERLPEYFEPVITWDGHCYSVEKRIPYIRDEDGEPIKAEWWVSDDYEEETDYYPNLRDGAAIAWMPLPKPYEGDKE